MVVIPFLGSVGLGLVWGWLMGHVGSNQHLQHNLVLTGVTLILGLEVFLFVDWRGLVIFLCATGLALVFHIQWRRGLRERFGPPQNH